jgi:Cytochrome P450
MLRHPHLLARLRDEPSISLRFVEELLRLEPPVQYLPNRVAGADIEIGGTTIPKGSRVVLLLAAASRDAGRFRDPDVFDPGTVPTTSTTGSAAGSTTASAPRSPGWRANWPSLPSPDVSGTRAWSRTRRPTGRVRCCAGRST